MKWTKRKIVNAFLGLSTIIIVFIFKNWSDSLEQYIGIRPSAALFFDREEWKLFIGELQCHGWYSDITIWNKYCIFNLLDFAFIVCYGLLLLCVLRPYMLKVSKANSDKKKKLIKSFSIISILLILSDLIETSFLFFLERNLMWMSTLKLVCIILLFFIILTYFIRKWFIALDALRYTLWYCRFSILGVLLTIFFLGMGQGKEMMIYMLESWQGSGYMAILYEGLFLLLIFYTGLVFWYIPRFFYPENPIGEYDWRKTPFQYDKWTNHFNISESSFEDDTVEKFIPQMEMKAMKQFSQIYDIPQKNTLDTPQTGEHKKNHIPMYRKWVPVSLSVLFYGSLLFFFGQLFFIILGSLNDSSEILMNQYAQYYWLVGILVGVLALFIVTIIYIAKNEQKSNIRKEFLHWCLIFFLIVSALVLCIHVFSKDWIFDYSMGLSGILLIVLFYTMISVFFGDKKRSTESKTYYLTTLVFVMLIANIVSTSMDNNHYDVTPISYDSSEDNKIPLEEYTSTFKSHLMANWDGESSIPVYFIAANGGGTTQAHWTASVLSQLRIKTNGNINDHIFAMSGASGGAVGMGVSSLLWDLSDKDFKEGVVEIYQQDYLSGGLLHFLTRDIWTALIPASIQGWRNRNSWLNQMYHASFNRVKKENNWTKPFHENWTNRSKPVPLYFANTTAVETGERYFSSVVTLEHTVGKDLMEEIMSKYPGDRTLSFGEAVMLSNRFPYINNSGKIDRVGHFIDGGFHDNSGMATLYELYEEVSAYFTDSDIPFDLNFIHISYGNGWSLYEPWNTCDTCNGKAFLKNINETMVPLMGAYKSLLYAPVDNRIDKVEQYGCKVYRFYLPDVSLMTSPPLGCDKKYEEELLRLKKEVKLNWVQNALGRTITENQQNYVEEILDIESMPPGSVVRELVSDYYAITKK